MMNGAAEKPVLTQAVPGQRGCRPMPGTHAGPDRLMADFEGLLAKHSVVQEQVPEQAEAKTLKNHVEKSPRATPEALFLALAGGAELAASDEDAEQPRIEDESGGDSAIVEADEKPSQPATIRAESPALVIAAVAPRIQAEPGEAKPITKDESVPKLKAAVADAAPSMIERVEDDAPVNLLSASPDNALSLPDADRPAVAEKKAVAKVAEDPPVAEKPSRSQDGAPPVTLIRVAGQETHFAPSPVMLFDDQKIAGVPLGTPVEAEASGRSQPVAPPVIVKAPNGPLKTLKVELGSHELGLVNATVALKDKALDLKIGAARDDAVASLRENAGRLSDALQALGYSVDAVSVQKMQQSDAGAQTGNGQPQQHDAGGQDARGQGQQRPSSGSGFGSENSSGQSRYSHRDDHLAEQEGNDHAKSTADSRNSRGVFL
jgi:hypothetical protein